VAESCQFWHHCKYTVNKDGTPANLIAAHVGNANAAKNGAFSRTGAPLAPRAAEIATALVSMPQVSQLDELGAQEIGRLCALIEAIDDDIARNGLTRRGDARAIVKLRFQASRRLQEWLDRYGLTPRGRADYMRERASGTIAFEIARRRAEGD
jgi:hypothetical protein